MNFARLVFSQSCSVFFSVVSFRLRIISLMLSFSAATSPCASTVIDRVRSPFVTAVATSAIARTCVVRFAASWFTLSVRSFHVPAAPGTLAWPPSLPSTPTSRATVVTWSANVASVSIMLLIVSASSAISPFASTVSLRFRSPLATAVTTFAMPRTWFVRLPAMKFTLSVRSFHVPATPFTSAWPPSLPSVPTSRATRVTSDANELSWSTIVLMVFFSSRISPFTSTVIFFDRSPFATAVVTSAMLRTWLVRLRGHEVHVVGQVLPRAGDAVHVGLAAELAFGADLARHARHFRRERAELVHHRVDGVLQLEDLALHVDGDLLREVAVGDGRRHVGDVAHLARQVAGHRVHVVGQVLPRAGDALHLGLAAELAFGADFARDARHFRRERAELVHHRVDGVLQLEDFALARRP